MIESTSLRADFAQSRIYVAGHRGLVGSAIVRCLLGAGLAHQSSSLSPGIITRTHAELDLTDQQAVRAFFEKEKPEHVFLAAAKVGGIHANNTYPAEFIYQNLAIQTHVIHEAWRNHVRRLLFLGSSCIYPRDCPQPMKEDYLLSGPLEPTNRPYALAKIAGIEMCHAYNRQYGTKYIAVMPTNLYGPGDNYDLETSHVLPALMRRVHEAKMRGDESVTVWGSGTPYREFLYSEDMASACVYLMCLSDETFSSLIKADSPPLINIGSGEELSIRELAELVKNIVGFNGELVFDSGKPDGAMRKLTDVSKLNRMGWHATTALRDGVSTVYRAYLKGIGDVSFLRDGIGGGSEDQ